MVSLPILFIGCHVFPQPVFISETYLDPGSPDQVLPRTTHHPISGLKAPSRTLPQLFRCQQLAPAIGGLRARD